MKEGKIGKGHLPVALLVILALGFILGHWLSVRHDPFFAQPVMDSYQFDRWAQEITAGDWLGKEVFFSAAPLPVFPGHDL